MGRHRTRPRRIHSLTASLLAALAVLTAACSEDRGTIEGLVIDVQGDLAGVTEFTVLTDDGSMVFEPDPAGDFAFPLPHLREHILSGIPVVVYWETGTEGVRSAVFVDDAGESAH